MITEKERRILSALFHTTGLTVDQFLQYSGGLYVNAWAPVFVKLRKKGLIERTGKKAKTRWGKQAHIHVITDAGREALGA